MNSLFPLLVKNISCYARNLRRLGVDSPSLAVSEDGLVEAADVCGAVGPRWGRPWTDSVYDLFRLHDVQSSEVAAHVALHVLDHAANVGDMGLCFIHWHVREIGLHKRESKQGKVVEPCVRREKGKERGFGVGWLENQGEAEVRLRGERPVA